MDNIWSCLRYFKSTESWGDPEAISGNPAGRVLLYQLDDLRGYVGRPIHIHSAYRPGDPGFHGSGCAVDVHIDGLSLWDQFMAAIRFQFSAIGVYPAWNNPGLHLDTRPMASGQPRAMWAWNGRMDGAKKVYDVIRPEVFA
jgi:uncharacterized protein YcbK (DUF882 family)